MTRIVYLDSSDVSKFAACALSGKNSKEYEQLKSAVQRKIIVCPISEAHIIECLGKTYSENSEARAHVLEELSAGFSFISNKDIFRLSVQHSVIDREKVLYKGWSWLDQFDIKVTDLLSKVRDDLLKSSTEYQLLSRTERRKLRTQSLKAMKSDKGFDVEYALKEVTGLDIPDDIVSLFRRALKKSKGQYNLDIRMRDFLGKPSSIYKMEAHLPDFRKVFLQTERFFNILKSYSEILDIENTLRNKYGLEFNYLEKLDKNLKEDISEWYKGTIPNSVVGLQPVGFLLKCMKLYVKDSSRDESARAMKCSDGGDLMHMVYSQYVDWWFGDKYSSNIVRQTVIDVNTSRENLYNYIKLNS